jgi:hypothetical protein
MSIPRVQSMFEVVDMPASGTRTLNDVVFTREGGWTA